jgi:SAM-dependent methyltransferase
MTPDATRLAGRLMCIAAFALALPTAVLAQQAGTPGPDWTATQWIPWLERPQRIALLKVDEIVASLDLRPGDIVADVGAGAGAFEPALARGVSPGGKVYANEIEPAFLEYIGSRMKERRIGNVVTVLGQPADPELPSRDVDVVLLHVVLHHVTDRAAFVRSIATYLKPTGRVAIIDLPPDTAGPGQNERGVSKAQVNAWMGAAGLKPLRQLDFLLPDKWFILYGFAP